MMDLLVQVTTAYKISPAGNVLQPYGESGILPYKPSTPIGALDTWIVHIVPKNQALHNPSNKINLKQLIPPFEQTHRFQVNLPRHQLYVTRVSGRSCIREILHQACSEKNLDPSKYTLRHPKHLDKPLCEELSIAEYGHNQITMLSIRNLPTAVSTEDILLMNKYKAASDSGSGSGASSSVSPVPPAQPLKPVRKRRPAPKPPAPQQKQQSDTMVCHSRTSSDSSGYHEASVLSESPDSNTSSLPDSLPRRSKLPLADHRVENKLSRSLSNLHQASTSAAATSALKPAQSTSSLLQGRKKKPAPLPPVAIAEEKEEKSAPGRRLSAEGTPEGGHSPPHSEQVLVAGGGRRKLPAAPVPRPRSTAFQTRPHTDVFLRLEGIFKKMAPDSPPPNPERESARLEAEIEEMFEQATREHVSLESGVELSRGPSPDWSWEYRLPAPPTFRDDVTTPSIAELQLMATAKSKQILFAPLESSEEVIKEESPTETRPALKGDAKDSPPICKDVVLARKTDRTGNGNIHITPTENKNIKHSSFSETVTDGHSDGSKPNGPVESISDGNTEVNKLNKIEKVYISQDTFTDVNIHKEIIAVTPELSRSLVRQHTAARNQRNSRGIDKTVQKHNEIKAEKVCININNEEPMDIVKNIGKVKIERSATVLRVIGRQERSQDQSAILNELTTVLTDRQTKPREAKPAGPPERPIVIPLTNFSITTYSGSKPVEIYKDKPVEINKEKPAVTELKKDPETQREINGIMRSNSSAEKKKIPTPVKRSASVVTTCQRRLDLSTLNGYLLEVEEFPLRNFRSNLRKTTSEYSINIDPAEEKDILPRPETGLQSLQVLRTILPQLSQSQGALHTLDQRPDKGEEKPAVCLTTWGERPKREVSIKTDRDYHVRSAEGVRVEVRAPLLAAERVVERRPRTSVYRSLETGNTKAIRLTGTDLGRLPIVTAVELKKQPDSEPKPEENGDVTGEKPLGGDKPLPSETPFRMEKPTDEEKSCGVDKPYLSENTFGLHKTDKPFPLYKTSRPESRQIRPPSYLFGCEPKVPPPPPPAPLVSPLVKLKPVSQRGETKKPPSADPRDQLLASIRNFGKSSLKKVSTR